jgi:hypothetical protein
MTDRYHALTVILDHDIRADDAEIIINAIRAIRHVLEVRPHVVGVDMVIATVRARLQYELIDKGLVVFRE